MKQFADALLSMTDGSTLSKDKLSVTKTSAGYCVAFAGSTATTSFTLDELKAEAKLDLERKSKRTVLVKSEGQYKTNFYAKNSLTLPTDTALIIVEIANFVTFAKDPSKAASDNITRDKLNSQDRAKELFGFVKEDGKWERGEVQKCLTAQVKQYKWEKAKAQAAQLCGGAKVAGRNNHIDFNASLVSQKTGNFKSFKSSNRQFEKKSANPTIGFKAKENYNSKGAVRGGDSGLLPSAGKVKTKLTSDEVVKLALKYLVPEETKPFDLEAAIKEANAKTARKSAKQAARRQRKAGKDVPTGAEVRLAKAEARKTLKANRLANPAAADKKNAALKGKMVTVTGYESVRLIHPTPLKTNILMNDKRKTTNDQVAARTNQVSTIFTF